MALNRRHVYILTWSLHISIISIEVLHKIKNNASIRMVGNFSVTEIRYLFADSESTQKDLLIVKCLILNNPVCWVIIPLSLNSTIATSPL